MTSSEHMLWGDRHQQKDALRQRIWADLNQAGLTVRDPVGHIPNFKGADAAAARLAELSAWRSAQVVKCNPDSPQTPVRLRALQEGKRLYMAVPRLSRKKCFVELTAEGLREKGVPLDKAATMRNALIHGNLVGFDEMQPIDVVIVGCVAVSLDGGRTGKGAGFADLELAMMAEFGLVSAETCIIATVHDRQIVENSELPLESHDWPLDWIVTPTQVIETHTQHPRPSGLDWDHVQPDQLKTIPILKQLNKGRSIPGLDV